MKKTRKSRVTLRNRCERTDVFISPAKWKTCRNNADLDKDWFVECRFFDPEHAHRYPKGFQYRIRLNEYKTLSERKRQAPIAREAMLQMLDKHHYNPITKTYMPDLSGELNRNTDIKTATNMAVEKMQTGEKHLRDVKVAIRRYVAAMDKLGISHFSVGETRISTIRTILDEMQLPPVYYNRVRQYVSDVYKILIEYDCIDHNPVREIRKRKSSPKVRELIPRWKLEIVDEHLATNHPAFFRYRKIFHVSGARSSELLRVQAKHVNIQNQEVLVQIQKGASFAWTVKAIHKSVVPLWEELLALSKSPEDFIFSAGLVPGEKAVAPAQITRRWNTHVKSRTWKTKDGQPFSVTEDFYSFKHDYLDKLDAIKSGAAQTAASHTSDTTTSIYTVNRKRREIEFLKNIDIEPDRA